ncbi:MAG: ribosome maturation factor RimM [Armatimonadota bacterium]
MTGSGKEPDVVIGTVVAPFGIKGEVKVKIETDFPERFEDQEEVWLQPKTGQGRLARIESIRFHQGGALIKFEGCGDRSSAEGLRGAELRIDESELMELDAGQYYVHDILGLDVYTTDGENIGKVTDVLQGAGNDIYVTPKAMIPAVKEFVQEIDLAGGKMIVKLIDGMISD